MVAITLGEFHHGILDDVESRMIVAYCEQSLFIGAPFSLREEFGKLLWRGQF
jgi:hypothetical protein